MKAKKSIKDHCRFHTTNLLELTSATAPLEKFDLLFCRNVFIYFNPEQIKKITEQLLSRLAPEGYFFIGISESLSGLKMAVSSPGPSVYRHRQAAESNLKKPAIISKGEVKEKSGPIRVLCVDDSQSILNLLKKILSSANEFEAAVTRIKRRSTSYAHEDCRIY